MQIWRALKLVRRLLCFSRLSGRGSQDHAVWDFAGRNHSPQGDEQFAGKGGLNLPVTAIILWNTRYLERAVAALRQAEEVPDHLLAYLSPLGWEHINLTRDYIWPALVHNSDHGRSLRA